MVASTERAKRLENQLEVSIPFIAGQWSLQELTAASDEEVRGFQSPSLRGSGRFPDEMRRALGLEVAFQSPSLRGSGRFRRGAYHAPSERRCFNPLHCGAVVASRDSLRVVGVAPEVSIPFIAGQWSLLNFHDLLLAPPPCFNPLHCGAVVASRMAGVAGGKVRRFNPLHCGAVVASSRAALAKQLEAMVSIPFIAGQWSLPPRTTPLSFCRVLLRNTRPACDHVLCARLHVWPKPVIIP